MVSHKSRWAYPDTYCDKHLSMFMWGLFGKYERKEMYHDNNVSLDLTFITKLVDINNNKDHTCWKYIK